MCHLLNFKKNILMIRHFTNEVIINLKWRKCSNKGKYKIYKIIGFFTDFHYFMLFWGTIFWHIITENYFMIWYSLKYNIDVWSFDYLIKTSIINLKQFNVDSINCIGWESNLSIKPQKYCLHSLNERKPVREI